MPDKRTKRNVLALRFTCPISELLRHEVEIEPGARQLKVILVDHREKTQPREAANALFSPSVYPLDGYG